SCCFSPRQSSEQLQGVVEIKRCHPSMRNFSEGETSGRSEVGPSLLELSLGNLVGVVARKQPSVELLLHELREMINERREGSQGKVKGQRKRGGTFVEEGSKK
ncbi:hypothetical protein DNTS_003625, partial [Danionella cerebrum]